MIFFSSVNYHPVPELRNYIFKMIVFFLLERGILEKKNCTNNFFTLLVSVSQSVEMNEPLSVKFFQDVRH